MSVQGGRRRRAWAAPLAAVVIACTIFTGVTTIAHAATGDPVAASTDTATPTVTDTATPTVTDTATPTASDTASPTASDTPTSSDTVTASPTATTTSPTDVAITTWWATRLRTFASGRTYYLARPFCVPLDAAACTDFLQRPRRMVIYAHPAGWPEDATTAASTLGYFHGLDPDTIYAFSVSSGGTKVFDAGVCCASAPVDEIGYLAAIVDDTAHMVGVDRHRVGLLGISNGGMLAERGTCERPDLFVAAASLSGSFAGQCTTAVTTVRQWHGAVDPLVPLAGGTVYVAGAYRTFQPAASLAQRMATGSQFQLDVLPGLGHSLPTSVVRDAVLWLSATLSR